ncbi:hypothetical protein MPER_10548, partial [Moniliophthora perniciosa FA553]
MKATRTLRNASIAGPSAALRERVRRPQYFKKLAKPSDLAPLFQNDDYVGNLHQKIDYSKLKLEGVDWMVWLYGCRVSKGNADSYRRSYRGKQSASKPRDEEKIQLFVGASVGPEVEDRWARMDMIAHRYPHQVGKDIAKGINAGRIEFADKHLSMFPQDLTYGYYSLRKKHGAPEEVRINMGSSVEVYSQCTEEGLHTFPGASIGANPEILQSAEKIIIEVRVS